MWPLDGFEIPVLNDTLKTLIFFKNIENVWLKVMFYLLFSRFITFSGLDLEKRTQIFILRTFSFVRSDRRCWFRRRRR